jgi:uncharacterized repeat protein (TIGR04076 family)
MFKVKATVVDFLGDTEKYPCHHQYKLGDEFIFDGESFTGRICPSLAISVVPRMMEIHSAGPRYKDYVHYYPFLYAPVSMEDPESKIYDGLGFKNIFTTYKEEKYNVANLVSSGSFKWPPPDKRITHRDIRMICPDYRTSVAVKIEAFDISDKGRNIPYFRREMLILDKLIKKPGIKADELLSEFSKKQIEDIYPALSKVMLEALLEELELMGYLEYKGGKVFANRKAVNKFNTFINSLSKEERLALQV